MKLVAPTASHSTVRLVYVEHDGVAAEHEPLGVIITTSEFRALGMGGVENPKKSRQRRSLTHAECFSCTPRGNLGRLGGRPVKALRGRPSIAAQRQLQQRKSLAPAPSPT